MNWYLQYLKSSNPKWFVFDSPFTTVVCWEGYVLKRWLCIEEYLRDKENGGMTNYPPAWKAWKVLVVHQLSYHMITWGNLFLSFPNWSKYFPFCKSFLETLHLSPCHFIHLCRSYCHYLLMCLSPWGQGQ